MELTDFKQGDRVELVEGSFAEVITVKESSLVVRCDDQKTNVRVYLDDVYRKISNS